MTPEKIQTDGFRTRLGVAIAMLVLSALLSAGCGGGARAPVWQWDKPGATTDDYKVDDRICEAEALEKTPVIQGTQDTVSMRQIKDGCLYKKGWRLYRDGVLQ